MSGVISSVALDRGLFMVSGLIVAIAGFLALVFVPVLSRGLRTLRSVSAVVLLILLGLSVLAVTRGWPCCRARPGRRTLPWLKTWLQSKESVILSAEEQLLNFHNQAPSAFWMSAFLNFVAHGLAIAEVYLILLLMGSKISLCRSTDA